MPRYKNVAGIAREVSRRYLNVGGIAREVSKGYTNINGVAREYYSNGVTWKKYNCEYDIGEFEEVGTPHYGRNCYSADFYSDYEFSALYGFTGVGDSIYRQSNNTMHGEPSDAFGMYYIEEYLEYSNHKMSQEVLRVEDGLVKYNNVNYFSAEIVACAEAPLYYYWSDDGYIGEITTAEGEFPEDGEIIDGSPDDSYCIIDVNGYIYYYVKQ